MSNDAGDAGAMSPLDVLLAAMRDKLNNDDWGGAVSIAKLAAPYVHPRAVARSGAAVPLSQLRDDELGPWTEDDDPDDLPP